MHRSQKIKNIQQGRIEKHRQSFNASEFANALNSPQLLSVIEAQSLTHRERKFSQDETLAMFLSQAMSADRSCQNAVNQRAVQRVVEGLHPGNTHTGSYCKARQRLPLSMVADLVRCSGKLVSEQWSSPWHWQGRPVKLIDGTTVTMPDTSENQAVYPQQSVQKPGLGFSICRIVGVLCLASGTVLDAALGPFSGKGSGEQSLLIGLLDNFKKGDIVLGDGYYGSYFLLAELIERGVDGVFEQMGSRKKSTDFRKGSKLGPKDHLITYEKPKQKPDWMTQAHYDAAPQTLTVRELKVGKKILVTTMLNANAVPKNELKALYKQRWNVELDLRNIKTTLGMETFSCKTPEMIEKEMWIYFLAYNLIRMTMVQAASLADLLPRQISFKHTLQIWRAWRQQSTTITDQESLQVLLILIAQNKVGNRAGRIEPRVIKRRPKPHPLMTEPRKQARERVRKFGHPRKQK